jgi:hypothetical protein
MKNGWNGHKMQTNTQKARNNKNQNVISVEGPKSIWKQNFTLYSLKNNLGAGKVKLRATKL